MLVTFSTDAYENITFFNSVAQRLLELMGHSGNVPGALKAEEVSEALTNLQRGIAKEKNQSTSIKEIDEDDDNDNEPRIELSTRALPLINLLEAAMKKNANVVWREA